MTSLSKQRIPLRHSLSYQQTKQTVIVAFIIGLVLSIGQIVIDYFSEQAKLSKSVSNILETANSTAFYAAYNIDETGAQQITEGLVSNIPIVEATIQDDFGKILGTAQNKNIQATSQLDKLVFGSVEVITRELLDTKIHQQAVGQLSISVDPSLMADSFLQRAGVVFISGIVRNTILALAIFAVFYFTFTRSILRATQPILLGRDKMEIEMPSNHQNDEIGALIGTFNDHLAIIDKQNKQILENNSNLETLIDKRTSQLNDRNSELELERKLAIEASMAKSEFLAMMSHEIRTPMNGILGMAELLEKKTLDRNSLGFIDAIIESSKSMLTLMNTVLDYSKYEHGQITFQHTDFEPITLVNSIIFLLSASAEKKHILLSLKVHDGIPETMTGDPEKLRQVLLNLVTNSIKFTQQGEVIVEIERVARNHKSGSKPYELVFTVSDSGIGIDDNEQQHIFEPYTQANSSIARQYGGSGMGLAICKQIVEQQKGKISCTSRKGEGTKFVVELSFDQPHIAGSIKSEPNVNREADQDNITKPNSVGDLKVLVTDDLNINRKLLQGQLEVAGHTAFLANDGAAALEIAETEAIDVVLLDLHMPGMDGIETTHRLREMTPYSIPIIGVTANVSEQKIDECLAAGMTMVVSKPIDQQKLNDALLHVMGPATKPALIEASEKKQAADIDKNLVELHKSSLGKEKFNALYIEAKESALRRIEQLANTDRANFELLQDRAHALSGLCANFGLARIAEKVKHIERSSEQSIQLDIAQQTKHIELELEQTFASILEQTT